VVDRRDADGGHGKTTRERITASERPKRSRRADGIDPTTDAHTHHTHTPHTHTARVVAGEDGEGESSSSAPPAPPPKAPEPEPEPEPEEDLSLLTPEELKAREDAKAALVKKEEGNGHYKAKRFDEAIAAYDAAIALDPKNMAFLLNKAAVKMEQKDYDGCVATCLEAKDVGRENRAGFADIAKAYVRAAKALQKKGDLTGAIDQCVSRAAAAAAAGGGSPCAASARSCGARASRARRS